MPRPIEFHKLAAIEQADAAREYAHILPELGERFLRESSRAQAFIAEQPLAGHPYLLEGIPEGVRRVFLRGFPYALVYLTEPRLVVVAVAHFSREPRYWLDRAR